MHMLFSEIFKGMGRSDGTRKLLGRPNNSNIKLLDGACLYVKHSMCMIP